MEFLSDQSSFSREMREEEGESGDKGSLFLWSVVIVVLMGLNAFSWIFCMYVFGNPEVPFNYQLLTHEKLNKLDPIKNFQPVTAPRGKFHTAKELYTELSTEDGGWKYNEEEWNAYNGYLKRLYLYNYKERSDVTFISGSFEVESARALEPDDVFPSGIAIRGRAIDFPAGSVDLVLPGPVAPEAHFKPGDQLELEESASCFAVIHAQRLGEQKLCFTAVPLVSRDFETPAATVISVVSPERLNLGTGHWPLSDDPAPPEEPENPAPAEGGETGEDSSEETPSGESS